MFGLSVTDRHPSDRGQLLGTPRRSPTHAMVVEQFVDLAGPNSVVHGLVGGIAVAVLNLVDI